MMMNDVYGISTPLCFSSEPAVLSDELKYPFMNTHVPDVFILIEFKVDVFDDRNWMLSHHFIRAVELSVFAVLVRQKAIYASL